MSVKGVGVAGEERRFSSMTVYMAGCATLPTAVADEDTTLTAAQSGSPLLVADVSADRTFTLPAVEEGLSFEFVSTTGAPDGHDWIISSSGTDPMIGSVIHLDTDAGSAGIEVVVVDSDGTDTQLQVNLPDGGTRVRFISDGTSWYVEGTVTSTEAPVFS